MLKRLYAKLNKKRSPGYYANRKAPAYSHLAVPIAGILGLRAFFRMRYKGKAIWSALHCIVNPLIWWFPNSPGCRKVNKFCADRWLRRTN